MPDSPEEVAEYAPEPDIDLDPMHGPGAYEAWQDGWRKGQAAAVSAIRKERDEELRERLLNALEKARQGAIGPGNCINFGELPAGREYLQETVQVVALADVNAAIAAAFDAESQQGDPQG